MTISFDGIPSGVRVPWAYIEFNNSNAQQGPSIQPYTTLIMGQKLAAGTQSELELVTVTSEAQARTLFGAGSQIHMMCRKYFQNDLVTPVKVVAIDDHASGVAATGAAAAIGVLFVLAGPGHAQILAPNPPPQPGQCKTTAEVGTGLSAGHALQLWSAVVANKYTNNWSLWLIAADKKVVPIKAGNQTIYHAIARPCFFLPPG